MKTRTATIFFSALLGAHWSPDLGIFGAAALVAALPFVAVAVVYLFAFLAWWPRASSPRSPGWTIYMWSFAPGRVLDPGRRFDSEHPHSFWWALLLWPRVRWSEVEAWRKHWQKRRAASPVSAPTRWDKNPRAVLGPPVPLPRTAPRRPTMDEEVRRDIEWVKQRFDVQLGDSRVVTLILAMADDNEALARNDALRAKLFPDLGQSPERLMLRARLLREWAEELRQAAPLPGADNAPDADNKDPDAPDWLGHRHGSVHEEIGRGRAARTVRNSNKAKETR